VSPRSANVETYSKIAANKLVPSLTSLLHSLAQASEWPIEIINLLSVSVDDSYNVHVDYPQEAAEEIENLEYGTFGGIPNAVIRPFVSRAQSSLKPVLEEITVGKMMRDMGIL